jgi:hypothetical protein
VEWKWSRFFRSSFNSTAFTICYERWVSISVSNGDIVREGNTCKSLLQFYTTYVVLYSSITKSVTLFVVAGFDEWRPTFSSNNVSNLRWRSGRFAMLMNIEGFSLGHVDFKFSICVHLILYLIISWRNYQIQN